MRLNSLVAIGIVVVLIVVTSIVLLHLASSDESPSYAQDDMWGAQIEEQSSYQRNIIAVTHALIDPLVKNHEFEVANVIKRIDDEIFVFDYGPMLVYRMDSGGDITGTYGLGRGRDPGYFQHLTDVAVDGFNDQVLVVDGMGTQISFFSKEGGFRHRVHFPFQFSRVEPLKDRLILFSYEGSMFRHVSHGGDEIYQHGELTEVPLDVRARDGYLLPGPEGGFIFVPSAGGYLFYFTYDGSTALIRRTIDRQLFSFESGEPSSILPDELISRVRSVHLSQLENRIQLFVNHIDNTNVCHDVFIDVYVWDTGVYLESFNLSCDMMNAMIYDEELIVSKDGSVYRTTP